jgi:glycerol-3-phosphate dehydrogenase (NAD(P)+)
VLRAETCTRRVGALAGPSPPRELAARQPCTLVVASLYDEVVRATQETLATPPCLRVYASHDLAGVELGSALASAFAVGLGVAAGAGAGPGARAALLSRGVAEGTRLIVAHGGKERTFAGLAGLGNLLVRLGESDGDYAIDYRHGLALGRGERPEAAETEGTHAIVGAVRLARTLSVRLPILEGLAALVAGDVNVGDATARLVAAAAAEE